MDLSMSQTTSATTRLPSTAMSIPANVSWRDTGTVKTTGRLAARMCCRPARKTAHLTTTGHRMNALCLACKGEGLDEDNEYCPACGGEGVIEI